MAPGLILGATIWGAGLRGPGFLYGLFCALLLAAAGGTIGALVAAATRAAQALPANFYGLCSGFDPEGRSDESPLTNWLAHLLNEIAGVPDERPLTFGDLWSAGDPSANLETLRQSPSSRAINFEVVTTCLSHGRPYRIPFDTEIFYYDPAEWRRLFPETIVAWMDANERPLGPTSPTIEAGVGVALRRFPLPEHIPVVVAARMSLSFPFLLGAVPLYAVDFTLVTNEEAKKAEKAVRAERCWFSDGGICSNFPIHFFDAPIPVRPTFGITLEPFPPVADVKADVWRPLRHNDGWQKSWTRLDGGMGDFVASILNAMQNWRDNTLSRVPGYRDRIVHIRQSPTEGGMNLEMSGEVIARLGERGREAGDMLTSLDREWWQEHRWTRFRSLTALLETWLARVETGYNDASEPLSQLVLRPDGMPPKAYPWANEDQRNYAKGATEALIALCREWADPDRSFQPGAPRPTAEIAIGPRT
jgi:hypothetical protein